MLSVSTVVASYLTVLGDAGCRSRAFMKSPLRLQSFGEVQNAFSSTSFDEVIARGLRTMGVIWLTLLICRDVVPSKGRTLGERSLNLHTEELDLGPFARRIPRASIRFPSRDRGARQVARFCTGTRFLQDGPKRPRIVSARTRGRANVSHIGCKKADHR